MNQRILELAMQANSHHDNFFDLNYKELDSFLEKFAELIVRECAQSIDMPSHMHGEAEHYFREAAQMIRQHFGVEE